jgi:hypothetical protein
MKKLEYYEIRQTCKLVDYDLKLAGRGKLWVETYRDKKYEYRALFPDVADWSAIPMTILTHPIHETQTDLS